MNHWEARRQAINRDTDLDAEEKAESLQELAELERDLREMSEADLIEALKDICDHGDDIHVLMELFRRVGGGLAKYTEVDPNDYGLNDPVEPSKDEDDDSDNCSAGHDWPSTWDWDEQKGVHYQECNRCSEEREQSHEEHGHEFGPAQKMRHEEGEIRANFECIRCGHTEQRGNRTGTTVIKAGIVSHPIPSSRSEDVELPSDMPGTWIE
jgi:hypothetical protein